MKMTTRLVNHLVRRTQLGAATLLSLNIGILCAADFPLAPAETTNPLVVEVAEATTNTLAASSVSGYDALVKRGAGTLVVDAALEAFDGTIVVEAGTLSARTTGALGTSAGATYVKDGATLEIVESADGSPDFTSETMVIAGTGVGGKGAIYKNSSNSGSKVFGPILLAGDAKVGSLSNQKQLSSIALNGHDLTFAGGSVTTLNGDATGPGCIIQSEGFLAFGKGKLASGTTAGSILIQKGAGWTTGVRWEYASAREWPLVFADGAQLYHRDAGNDTPSDQHYWNGPVTLQGKVSCWKYGTKTALYTFNGAVGGVGSFDVGEGFTLALSATSGGTWSSGVTKTGAGELVYASLAGATSLDVQKGSVRLSPTKGRSGVPGLTETYCKGVGNKINATADYPIGTTTNGVFSNARYASYGNGDFVKNMVGQMEKTTWIYDGYLWVPGANGGADVTWTWLAGVQSAMSVYVDGTRILDTASEAAYNEAVNVNTGCKEVMKNVALAPGGHHLQVRCYTENGWCGGYLWNFSTNLSLTSMGLMVATNNLMTTTQSDYMLLTDPGDGTLLTATSEKSVETLSFASFGEVTCAAGTTLVIDGSYSLDSLKGFPSVTGGDLTLTGTYYIDGQATPGRLTVEGTLTFGEDAAISVSDDDLAAFKKLRSTYVNGYVLMEATKIEGTPKMADALAADGWKAVLNDAKTQVTLERNRGFLMIIR